MPAPPYPAKTDWNTADKLSHAFNSLANILLYRFQEYSGVFDLSGYFSF